MWRRGDVGSSNLSFESYDASVERLSRYVETSITTENLFPTYLPRVAPFNNLLQKGTKFCGLQNVKRLQGIETRNASDRILCHYDLVTLYYKTDASPVGMGAVLSHIMAEVQKNQQMFHQGHD
ncbi:hypothetical protein HNY73_006461 [Argiope bruennichi]|uniref:Uncharacterized protein n=1 Tax=Argiope bruennichi TaxID=94029 RepID=A0A8T0FQ80_ARGBR|nr:hypothetical protein HNY73_006461 [Argiope bruennichi]